ncbi:MAG: hypothetical protein WDW36_005055 [Sanguina aurantia]
MIDPPTCNSSSTKDSEVAGREAARWRGETPPSVAGYGDEVPALAAVEVAVAGVVVAVLRDDALCGEAMVWVACTSCAARRVRLQPLTSARPAMARSAVLRAGDREVR